ncbi:putative N-acetyltransferase domain-containing protein [uncultured Gammaproteobacteria bacterium]
MLRFTLPTAADAQRVLSWRRQERVTRAMFSDVAPDLARHTAWLLAGTERQDYRHWLIMYRDRPIGLINLQKINRERRESGSGFYIGEDEFLRLTGVVLPHFYNWMFFDRNYRAMTAEVIAGNDEILRLHAAHGYRETALDRGRVIKNGEVFDVHHLRLEREAWLGQTAYHRYRAEFPTPGLEW